MILRKIATALFLFFLEEFHLWFLRIVWPKSLLLVADKWESCLWGSKLYKMNCRITCMTWDFFCWFLFFPPLIPHVLLQHVTWDFFVGSFSFLHWFYMFFCSMSIIFPALVFHVVITSVLSLCSKWIGDKPFAVWCWIITTQIMITSFLVFILQVQD